MTFRKCHIMKFLHVVTGNTFVFLFNIVIAHSIVNFQVVHRVPVIEDIIIIQAMFWFWSLWSLFFFLNKVIPKFLSFVVSN